MKREKIFLLVLRDGEVPAANKQGDGTAMEPLFSCNNVQPLTPAFASSPWGI